MKQVVKYKLNMYLIIMKMIVIMRIMTMKNKIKAIMSSMSYEQIM